MMLLVEWEKQSTASIGVSGLNSPVKFEKEADFQNSASMKSTS